MNVAIKTVEITSTIQTRQTSSSFMSVVLTTYCEMKNRTGITLFDIWNMPTADVHSILLCSDLTVSENDSQNRVLVARKYISQYSIIEQIWLKHPSFDLILSAANSLKDGLYSLCLPFVLQLFHMHNSVYILQLWVTKVDKNRFDADKILQMCIGDTTQVSKILASICGDSIQSSNDNDISYPKNFSILQTGSDAHISIEFCRALILLQRLCKFKTFSPMNIHLFNPYEILLQLMKINISSMLPIAQYIYLNDIWCLFQLIPFNDALYTRLYHLFSIAKSSHMLMIPPYLQPRICKTLSKLGGGVWNAIHLLIREYTGCFNNPILT